MANELPLAEMVLAAGALGTAAFGIVEGLKWTGLGVSGYSQISKTLGAAVMGALGKAYGPDYDKLLKAQYRTDRLNGDLPRTLRQGVRIGLLPENAGELAKGAGVVDSALLVAVAEKTVVGKELSNEERSVLGRFELAVDTRIDAALALAESAYRASVRIAAGGIAVLLALVATAALAESGMGASWTLAVIIGIAAVPLAPIAKDVSKALEAATKAVRPRK